MRRRVKRGAAIVRLIRPRQWLKNTFVLAPLLFARRFDQVEAWLAALYAFAVFSATASAVYALNDVVDRERDRQHPQKRLSRPIASGDLSVTAALAAASALFLAAGLGVALMPKLQWPVAAYIIVNLAYSFYLKHQPLLDLFAISASFVLRIYAGAAALAVPVSHWMLITAIALTLFLATLKRKGELISSGSEARAVLATYTPALLDRYAITAATGTLVFYALYTLSEAPALTPTVPLVLAGLFRYWYLAENAEAAENPTVAVSSDWLLAAIALSWGLACLWLMRN